MSRAYHRSFLSRLQVRSNSPCRQWQETPYQAEFAGERPVIAKAVNTGIGWWEQQRSCLPPPRHACAATTYNRKPKPRTRRRNRARTNVRPKGQKKPTHHATSSRRQFTVPSPHRRCPAAGQFCQTRFRKAVATNAKPHRADKPPEESLIRQNTVRANGSSGREGKRAPSRVATAERKAHRDGNEMPPRPSPPETAADGEENGETAVV